MPAAYTTMTLSDGTTTADLVDGVNYQLLLRSYAPTLAGRRRMNMAGRTPYVPAAESITIYVRGTDGATCLANQAKLVQLLDQAERFTAGDQIPPVLYTIQPQGSVLTDPLQSMVYGRASGSSGVNLPMTYNDKLFLYEIGPVQINFVRGGLLIAPPQASITAADVSPNPTIREVTFTSSHAIPSPIKVQIIGWEDTEHPTIESPSMLFITAEKEDLLIIEAETLTATNFTSETDAGNNPSGGNVLEFTAPDSDEYFSGGHTVDSATFNLDTEEIAVYAMLRGHATEDFFLWAESASYVFNSAARTRDPFVVAAGEYTSPLPVHLGNLIQRQGHHYVRLVAQWAIDNGGTPTMHIDYIVLVAMKSTTYIYQLGDMYLSSPFIDSTPSNVSILIDPRPLTSRAPFVGYTESSADNEAEVDSRGDGSLFMPGQTIASLWMGRRGTDWVDVNAADFPTPVGMRATRSLAYLAPQ